MRKIIDDIHLMVKVCDLYYNQNISQQQIAAELNLSRPTVSRLLASAREKGVVRIHISNMEEIKYWELERTLEKKYHLKNILITDDPSTEEDLRKMLGEATSRYLEYTLKDGYTVGVSAGETIYQAISGLSDPQAEEVTFVPLIGGLGKMPAEYQANYLAEQLSRIYKGSFVPFHVPARVSGKALEEELRKEESLNKAFRMMEHLDVAVVEIGDISENASIEATGYLKENEIDLLRKRNAAGELCMQFYDIAGKISSLQKNNCVIGMDIQKLKNVPHVIGIGGGIRKLSAIRGALAGQYIHTLITDKESALALLEA